ncbi:MAG: DegT/DnrJ/EryC1/StrS family aminotransferase [Clostridiales bacterium]
MQVPFLDLKLQYQKIKNEINTAIQNVMESGAFILGKPVYDFESKFAEIHNVKHCIGLSSGTDGNHAALWALGIKREDEVIIPANTFIATAWGAVLNGATPVFVDCEPGSYNLDPLLLEKAISPRTKAIVAVHLYGQPADIDPIKNIADKNGLFLVEDCAQSHMAEYKGKKIGGFGEVASFSFYPGKNLGAYGESGAVTTNRDNIAAAVRMIRDHGASEKYDHIIYGHNYRMEALQAAILIVKLNYLKEWTEKRRRIAALYNELLNEIEEIMLPAEMHYARHVYHLFVIQLRGENFQLRDKFAKYLNENGISTGLHYPIPLHLQTCFKNLGYKKGEFPVTEHLASYGLSLPLFPEMTLEQVLYVCRKISEFFGVKNLSTRKYEKPDYYSGT